MTRRVTSYAARSTAPREQEPRRPLVAAYARDLAKRKVEAAQEKNTPKKTFPEPGEDR